MRGRALMLFLLLLALSPSSGRAQILGRPEFLLSGVLDRFPDDEGRVTVRGRDGERYTLFARGARVEVGNRGPGNWEELRPGRIVDVYGEWRGRRAAEVGRLHVVGGETGVPPREAIREWREGGRREVTGRVLSVDRARQSLRVRAGEEIVSVEAYDRTRFLRQGRRISLRELAVGARVRVRGEVRSGRLLAEEVILLGSSS